MSKVLYMLDLFSKILYGVNVLKTIYVNFKVFPFREALKLPIFIGHYVYYDGLYKGCIKIKSPKIHSGMIRLGCQNKYPIFPNQGNCSQLRFSKGAIMILGDDIRINSGFSISNNGIIKIGDDFIMNQNCMIYCRNEISIGCHCRIGWKTQMLDTDFHVIYKTNGNCVFNPEGCIRIGNNVWISNSCSILKRSIIPPFSIIAAGSLVNKDLSYCTSKGNLFAGIPVEFKGSGIYRILNTELESELIEQFKASGQKTITLTKELDDQAFRRK